MENLAEFDFFLLPTSLADAARPFFPAVCL
jgi:hypothetical protein